MDAIAMIKERRSVRKFTDEIVPRELLNEIVDAARFAPSWANTQIARYTFVEDADVIARIASEGVRGFTYNMGTLQKAKGVLVQSHVLGKSGKLEGKGEGEVTVDWEMFDAGIACQTFCLAAHAKGVGTCIFGVIDEKEIAKIINLPEGETVSAVIVYGFPSEETKTPKRHEVADITRFI